MSEKKKGKVGKVGGAKQAQQPAKQTRQRTTQRRIGFTQLQALALSEALDARREAKAMFDLASQQYHLTLRAAGVDPSRVISGAFDGDDPHLVVRVGPIGPIGPQVVKA